MPTICVHTNVHRNYYSYFQVPNIGWQTHSILNTVALYIFKDISTIHGSFNLNPVFQLWSTTYTSVPIQTPSLVVSGAANESSHRTIVYMYDHTFSNHLQQVGSIPRQVPALHVFSASPVVSRHPSACKIMFIVNTGSLNNNSDLFCFTNKYNFSLKCKLDTKCIKSCCFYMDFVFYYVYTRCSLSIDRYLR